MLFTKQCHLEFKIMNKCQCVSNEMRIILIKINDFISSSFGVKWYKGIYDHSRRLRKKLNKGCRISEVIMVFNPICKKVKRIIIQSLKAILNDLLAIKVNKLFFAYDSGHNIITCKISLFQLIIPKLYTLSNSKILNSTNTSLYKNYYVSTICICS